MKYTIVLTTDTEPEIVEPILNEALNAFSLALQEIGGPFTVEAKDGVSANRLADRLRAIPDTPLKGRHKPV
jgi:hypothetical protein